MSLVKRIGKSERVRGVICWLIAQYVRLVWITGNWRIEGGHIPARLWEEGQPFILSFWHGRLLMMTKCWRPGLPFHMLISQHRDGQIIARTVAHLGIDCIAGSSTRGGAQAFRSLLKALKSGESVGMTPDGPKGPRMRATDGVINVARLSGCPVVPAACSSAGWRLTRSWDRFLVPLPFSRGVIIWGEPFTVPRDADKIAIEQYRLTLEQTMTALTDAADIHMGETPVPPAEIPS